LRKVLFIVLVATCALPATAHATFPGQNGEIAFERGGDIWTMNPDGTNQVNLTNDSAPQGAPAWSADGSKLAFTQNDGSGSQIWKMLADGTGRMKLSDGTTGDFDPSWSPDDQKILFTSCCPPGHDFTLETMNADGTGRTVLGDSLRELFATDWASDGSTAWSAADPCGGASVVLSTFGTLTAGGCGDPPLNSFEPSWSPDSQHVAYAVEVCSSCLHYAVSTVNRDGTDPHQLTAPPADGDDRGPAWSPDGSKIAFYRSGRIKVMNSDGTGIVDVTDGTGPSWQPIPINSYARPKGATPMRVSLVPASTQCTSPNNTHGAPLSYGSCSPPELSSQYLTTGTPDANGLPVRMSADLTLKVLPGDVAIDAHVNDVLNKDLSDYSGSLEAALPLRITDKDNTPSPGGPGAATTKVIPFTFAVPCAADPDPAIGSDCTLSTSADTLVPGAIKERLRTIWQVGQVRVFDGGADEDGSTAADNTVFAVEGVFVP
jgi:hypothetical protein